MSEVEASVEELTAGEVAFPRPGKDEVGWLLVGGGAVGALVTLFRRDSDLVDWLLPLSLFGIGCSILLGERQTRMDSAEEQILAELEALDPIARAQVLKAVAQEELSKLPGVGSSD